MIRPMSRRIEAGLDGRGRRFAIVVARFNALVTERLADGAERALIAHGVDADAIDVIWVPGAYELPWAAQQAAESGRYDAAVCLGAVIRGETDHYDYVCGPAASGLAEVGRRSGLPIGFGLLTCDTTDQALARAGGKAGNKGADAALAALELANLRSALADAS